MSYENAVPKPLKFLISDGKMIDDAGNVIAESDTLKDLYTKWNPEVKKYLLSDGSVVDEEGNLIVKNDYYKKMYDQAIPKVAKYLHADGTIDENPGGGSANLEDNVQTIIDVSTYTQPVEVLPISGKDGMKKNTITLNNIPSPGGVTTLYAWSVDGDTVYFNISIAPSNSENIKKFEPNSARTRIDVGTWESTGGGTYEKVSDTEFTSDNAGYVETFIRDTENDLVI